MIAMMRYWVTAIIAPKKEAHMKTLTRSSAALAATLFCAALLPAQDIQYKSVTSSEFGGPLANMMKLAAKMGGASGDLVQTTYLKDRKLRSDMEKTSSIIDLDAGKIISIDHGKKQYVEMTFAEMQAALAKATAQPKGGTGGEAKIEVRVDATDEKQEINGVSAQRYFLTTTITAKPSAEQKEQGAAGGQLVLLNEMWLTKDGMYKAASDFNQATTEAMGDHSQRMLAVLFAQYPNATDGVKRAAEEMKKLDGAPARTITYFVTLPENMQFDRAKLLAVAQMKAAEPEKKKGGLGAMLKAAAKASAGQSDKQPSEATPDQVLLFRSTTDITDVASKSLDAGLFLPPVGYKKVAR
jgi:hypothetical protein